jgi:hypothetical protein
MTENYNIFIRRKQIPILKEHGRGSPLRPVFDATPVNHDAE